MPFKRLFEDKYVGSSPENASVVRTLFDLFTFFLIQTGDDFQHLVAAVAILLGVWQVLSIAQQIYWALGNKSGTWALLNFTTMMAISTVNIFLYIAFSKKFRQTLWNMMKR